MVFLPLLAALAAGCGPRHETPPRAPEAASASAPAPAKAPPPATDRGWKIPGLDLELIRVEPGVFVMGPAEDDPFRNRSAEMGDGPPTTVTLVRVYWLGRTEVTRAQYEALMGTNSPPQPVLAKTHPEASGEVARLPAVNVTWTQAVEFCRALTERERKAGRLPAGRAFRLPTEAEWEYACRAGTGTRHPAGADAAALNPLAWFAKTTAPFTRRDGPRFRSVGLKRPNAWGFHDMLGNVREWCADWYAPLPGGAVTNWAGPAAPHQVKNETRAFRVARGGSWIDGERTVGSGARDWYGPEYGAAEGFREGTVGFRIAAAEEGPLR